MNADWEIQQEQLIRNAECLPELDVALRRRVLLGAAVAQRTSRRRRFLAIAASVLLFVGTGTFTVSRIVSGMQSVPVAETKGQSLDSSDDGLFDQAVDRQQERSRVFPTSMLPLQ
jgi:hypothetical protein